MAFIFAMIYYSIFRRITNEFIYVVILTYVFHYVTFGTIHILLNAKAKEYDVESDGFRVKNLIAIPVLSILMAIFIKSPQAFHWYYIFIPIVSDLISVPILKRWYINWKDTVIYSFLFSFKTNGYVIILSAVFIYASKVGIPVAIFTCLVVSFIITIIGKMNK